MVDSIAWMAGLFEGEGCISIHQNKGYCQLQLKSTDEDVLMKFAKLAGTTNKITYYERPGTLKNVWMWQTGNRKDVTRILELLFPYFGERRACATLNVFDYYDGCFNCTPPEPIALG
jgi:hypothetical protein